MNTSLIAYTYILECSNGAYYVGSTNDLERRLQEHQAGEGANYTSKHLPVKLVYWEEYQNIDEAFRREKQLHGWSRAKKEALINGDIEKLKSVSSGGPSTGSGTTGRPATGTGTTGRPSAGTGTAGRPSAGTGTAGRPATGTRTTGQPDPELVEGPVDDTKELKK